MVHVFNAGLLARSQFASGRSCGRPNRSRFCVVFLVPSANSELVRKLHIALHASHAALPMVTPKNRSNVALPVLDQMSLHFSPSNVIEENNSDHMHYLKQKDERVLPGNLQNRRYSFLPPLTPNVFLSLHHQFRGTR
jgi:hypothetical protein